MVKKSPAAASRPSSTPAILKNVGNAANPGTTSSFAKAKSFRALKEDTVREFRQAALELVAKAAAGVNGGVSKERAAMLNAAKAKVVEHPQRLSKLKEQRQALQALFQWHESSASAILTFLEEKMTALSASASAMDKAMGDIHKEAERELRAKLAKVAAGAGAGGAK